MVTVQDVNNNHKTESHGIGSGAGAQEIMSRDTGSGGGAREIESHDTGCDAGAQSASEGVCVS